MLPAHIIYEIQKRERQRERELLEELIIDFPVLTNDPESDPRGDRDDDSSKRGVVILDFTI